MKVLFLNEALGGHTTVHHNLAHELRNHADVEATFLDIPAAGLTRRILGGAIPGLDRLDLDFQPVRAQLLAALVGRRLLEKHGDKFDVWHIYTANAGLLSVDLMRKHPCVVTTDTTNVHNIERIPQRQPTRFSRVNLVAVKRLERRVLESADAVVANSNWAAESMLADYGLADERIHRMPFGISAPNFDGAAPGTAETDELPRFTFVGRQLQRKGALRLLRLHQDKFRDRFRLVLVTTEDVDPAPNVEVISDIRPGDGRIWEVLRSSAVFVFPSPIDQAPNAILEAMAAGLPVIACDTAAQPEMVIPGETGELVVAEDDASLEAALESMLHDPAARIKMGTAGRARMLSRYDMAASAEGLVSVLNEVVASSPKRVR